MEERPILFSGEMVSAILDGRKTQTRRVIKPQPPALWDACAKVDSVFCFYRASDPDFHGYKKCPYGQPGDRLWVREAFATDIPGCPGEYRLSYRADHIDPLGDGPTRIKWTPAIHMFREYSRINLEVVSVRVERVQDITDEDVFAEGIEPFSNRFYNLHTDRDVFARLWDSINLKRGYGWDSNPWVWVVEFKRLP